MFGELTMEPMEQEEGLFDPPEAKDLFGDPVVAQPVTVRSPVGQTHCPRRGLKKKFATQLATYRPTRFGVQSKYRHWMCEAAYEILCQGRTLAAVAATLHVCKPTILRWIEEYPEFSDAVGRGMAVAEDLWAEEKYQEMHPTIYKLQMAQRFDWRDKTEEKGATPNGFTLIQNMAGADAPGAIQPLQLANET